MAVSKSSGDPYENLANAIILQAVTDYRMALKKKYLMAHPVCVKCMEEGRITEATVVDHIIPHRGDMKLFWNKSNWQSLCEHHHNVKTKTDDLYEEYRF